MTDFQRLITVWYRQNKRPLPWRFTKNAFHIWLSEVILQQTRVDQGLNYYLKFIEKYPTIFDLAQADENEVLKLWQGLGYYSRARNLHVAAKQVVDNYNGNFPNNYKSILELKGIGEYTAAAIASFAFDLPHAVLDGNVFRVLSRIYDIDLAIDSTEGKKLFAKLADELLPAENFAEHNQAMMEFGALQCVPKNPNCSECPINLHCLALKNNTVSVRPYKKGKVKITKRYFYFLYFNAADSLILEKRGANDIWQHLYQFPLLEFDREMHYEELKQEVEARVGQQVNYCSSPVKHILSHQHIYATFIHFDELPKVLSEGWVKVADRDFADYPIPRLIDRYLDKIAVKI